MSTSVTARGYFQNVFSMGIICFQWNKEYKKIIQTKYETICHKTDLAENLSVS